MSVKISVNRNRVAGNKAATQAGRVDKVSPAVRVERPTGVVHADTVELVVDGRVIARFLSDFGGGGCASVWCEVEDDVEVKLS